MVREYRELDEPPQEDAVRLVFETGKPITARCAFVATSPTRGAAHDRPARRPAAATRPGDRGVHRTAHPINPASAQTDCR